ncbi:MAG: hypothetical protein Unbinned92contig1002_15 [Prokaryotic dsDNA virus sp.]|nr:MAG: hypothetical protein Unbinned92contig1002_15 [Prokaryotic dsDNA virus sp.]|tara:strand:- start:28971 stop:29189 length:219 start_codon:yes stop_codon:yes gene_type:complete
MKLFEDEWGIDNSPIEEVEITTTLLYFNKQELKEFKYLCKAGMSKHYGAEAQTKGNLSDYLLLILRQANENN